MNQDKYCDEHKLISQAVSDIKSELKEVNKKLHWLMFTVVVLVPGAQTMLQKLL